MGTVRCVGFCDLGSQHILTLSMYILMLPLSMNSAIMCSGEGEMKIEAPPVYARDCEQPEGASLTNLH